MHFVCLIEQITYSNSKKLNSDIRVNQNFRVQKSSTKATLHYPIGNYISLIISWFLGMSMNHFNIQYNSNKVCHTCIIIQNYSELLQLTCV